MPDGADPLPPLREVIAAHDLSAKKSLGQNFLFDLNLTRRIARAAGPLDGTTVYELGPGPGGLTRALLGEGAARVVAVERDTRCLPALAEIADAVPGRARARRGQPALQCRHRAPGEMADGADVLLAEPDAHVPARGRRAHRGLAGKQGLWTPVGAGAVAHAREDIVRRLTARLHPAAEGDLCHPAS